MDKNEPWYVILNMDFRYEICRRCPKIGLFKGTYKECEKWIERKEKEEKIERLKNKLKAVIKNEMNYTQKANEENIDDLKNKLKEVIINEINYTEKKNESNLDNERLKRELSIIMNSFGIDTECNTPDYILAGYLIDCLKSYKKLDDANRTWYGLSIEGELKL